MQTCPSLSALRSAGVRALRFLTALYALFLQSAGLMTFTVHACMQTGRNIRLCFCLALFWHLWILRRPLLSPLCLGSVQGKITTLLSSQIKQAGNNKNSVFMFRPLCPVQARPSPKPYALGTTSGGLPKTHLVAQSTPVDAPQRCKIRGDSPT